MSISGGAGSQTFDEINVTPLTDVFLVLLVIMMLITPIMDKSDLKIKPPETRNAKKSEERNTLTIEVDKEGRIYIGGKPIPAGSPPEMLQARLESSIKNFNKKAEDVPVVVNADGDARQRDVVAIMSAAAACGIRRMRIATQQHGGG